MSNSERLDNYGPWSFLLFSFYLSCSTLSSWGSFIILNSRKKSNNNEELCWLHQEKFTFGLLPSTVKLELRVRYRTALLAVVVNQHLTQGHLKDVGWYKGLNSSWRPIFFPTAAHYSAPLTVFSSGETCHMSTIFVQFSHLFMNQTNKSHILLSKACFKL